MNLHKVNTLPLSSTRSRNRSLTGTRETLHALPIHIITPKIITLMNSVTTVLFSQCLKLTEMELFLVYSLCLASFTLQYVCKDSFMLLHVTVAYSFSLLYSILLQVSTIYQMSINIGALTKSFMINIVLVHTSSDN